MRLIAQAALGYYKAPPDAVQAIRSHLRADRPFTLLDPCAGQGEALKLLADALNVPADSTYAVELDAGRSADVAANIPGVKLLGPASYFGTRISPGTFGLIYCNPPFDDQLGGGMRDEHRFASRAIDQLDTNGILALVVPITAIRYNNPFQEMLECRLTDLGMFAFPAHCRPYKELVIFGRRPRREAAPDRRTKFFNTTREAGVDEAPVLGTGDRVWAIPATDGPRIWLRSRLTQGEILEALARSPLTKLLADPVEMEPDRPLLPLYKAHIAMTLAAQIVGGVIEPEGEPPHVVRGTVTKQPIILDDHDVLNEKGRKIKHVTKSGNRPVVTLRAVGLDGHIYTFTDTDKEPTAYDVAPGPEAPVREGAPA